MKSRKLNISTIFYMACIILLVLPQTTKHVQIAINKMKVSLWSPTINTLDTQPKIAPFEYEVATLSKQAQNIPIAKGRITFVSYWATWCPPCVAELPSIQKLYKAYGEKVAFVLLTNEDVATVKRFMHEKGYQLPVYTPQMESPELLKESSIPTNFLIDAQGKILIKETGAANWNSNKVRRLLDSMLLEAN